jgi:hypothetical protein
VKRVDWASRCLGWLARSLLCLLLSSCGTDSAGGPANGGPKAFGERCQKTEDCGSLLCVRVDESGGICSQVCGGAQDCPASDNWGCLASPTQSFSVCACLPLGPTEVCGDGMDNDCDGKVDDCRICGGHPVSNDDRNHCGACGSACRDDQLCESGKCLCTDAEPDQCGDSCTALTTDSQNCGACGVACSLGQTCKDGTCTCPDFAKPDFCPGTGCVSLRQDADDCGACGTTCTLGQVCDNSACRCPAGSPPDFCDGVGCVDLTKDAHNCGECGTTCPADQQCSNGACSCPSGKTSCGDKCVDAQTDRANCGECDNTCPAAQACVNGQCGCSAAGLSVCGDGCANLQTDVANCGACDNACAAGELCSSGSCLCQSGLHCAGECKPSNDNANCGSCGAACSGAQYCNANSCECSGFGLTECGSNCFDTYNDELHCGSCDTQCRTGETCNGGYCACPYPQQYCESAGKCVSLSSDTANCGSCGQTCDPTETCSGAQCVCPTQGQEFCAAEGKCVDTQSNAQHCGSCDTACKPTEVCSYGSCDCTGYSEQYCAAANACVDIWTDDDNCGACDTVCPAKTHCAGAGCQCDTAGQTLCGTSCFDLQTNAKNCGECGNDCGGSYVCSAGKCQCPAPTVGVAVRLSNNAVNDSGAVAAWDGTHVGVAYLQQIVANGSYSNLRFALLNPDGTLFKDIALTSYTDGTYKSVGSTSGTRPDKLGITWNGSEYAIVWNDIDHTAFVDTVRLVRVTPSGVASASVTVATNSELPGPFGVSVGWSVPYGGYLISGSISNQVFYRRVGALGTSLQTPNTYSSSYTCNTALAVAPDGRAAVSCNYAFYGNQAYFEADGSRTREVGGLGVTQHPSDSETLWDGTTFDTAVAVQSSGVRLFRDGSTLSWIDLLPYTSGVTQTAVELVWLGNSLALGSVAGGVYTLDRYNLTAALNDVPGKIHAPVSIVSTPNVLGKPELVQAGTGKLLAIWPDNRWGNTTELYAAPIDLKACP